MYFNFFNLVEVKIEESHSRNLDYIKAEYGEFEIKPDQENPDIVIKFINDVTDDDSFVSIRQPIAYDEKGVFFYDYNYKVARLDFASIDEGLCEISCDVNFDIYFLTIILEYVLNAKVISKDHIFCHSSAVKINDKVILMPAWRNVGKTNLLIYFLKQGGEYIADDWSIINSNGYIKSLPKRLNLLYYNFKQHPELISNFSDERKDIINFIKRVEEKSNNFDLDISTIKDLKYKTRKKVSPYDLFETKFILDSLKIDEVFLLRKKYKEKSQIEKISSQSLVNSVSACLEFEHSYFHRAYLAYKAQTGKHSSVLENHRQLSNRILSSAFGETSKTYLAELSRQEDTEIIFNEIMNTIINGG